MTYPSCPAVGVYADDVSVIPFAPPIVKPPFAEIDPVTVKFKPTPAFPIIFVPDVALPMTVEPIDAPVLVLILTT